MCFISRLISIVAFLLLTSPAFAQAADTEAFSRFVTGDGKISVPDNYRDTFQFIGAWAIRAGDEDGTVKGFHIVYMEPDDVAQFRETGEFPDGAIIVKELLSAENGSKTTGDAAWAGDIVGWFVMVKDQTDRFKGNPLWGNGWGWSYFGPDDRTNTTSTNFRIDCLGCHIPARKTDWIFMDGYGVLAKAE